MLIAGGGGSYPSFPDVLTAVNKMRLQAANCEEEKLEAEKYLTSLKIGHFGF